MKQLAPIEEVFTNPRLLGNAFKDRSTWAVWFCFFRAFFGLPLSEDEKQVYYECTARTLLPEGPHKEAWLVCGRRAGKSRALAFIAVFLSCFCDWADCLALGERGTLLVVATDRRQARVIFRYIYTLLASVPELAAMIVRETAEIVELSNGIAIEIATASFRSIRGPTLIAALLDEAAFWRCEDSSNPDHEILQAVRPALATTGGPLLVASSPYAKRGILWNAFRRHYGEPGNILVWKAETRRMNPTVPQSVIDEALEADASAAAAEFRDDLESFVSAEAVDAVVMKGVRQLSPNRSFRHVGFVDAAGGSGGDSMTLAIAHYDYKESCTVLDAVYERQPPFSPESVVSEFAGIFKTYGVSRIQSDKWGGQFVVEAFQRNGIQLEPAELTKSGFYGELLPLINSRRCRIPENKRLISQLTNLERRVGRGTGKDSIDHPVGLHDDVANACAGAIVLATQKPPMKIHPDVMARARIQLGERARLQAARGGLGTIARQSG